MSDGYVRALRVGFLASSKCTVRVERGLKRTKCTVRVGISENSCFLVLKIAKKGPKFSPKCTVRVSFSSIFHCTVRVVFKMPIFGPHIPWIYKPAAPWNVFHVILAALSPCPFGS